MAFGFSGNGLLRGSIAATDDTGDPLGWEHSGNWSSTPTRERAIKDLAATVGIPEDRARKAIADALREARRQTGFPADGAPQRPTHELTRIVTNGRQPREIEAEAWKILERANQGGETFFIFGNALSALEYGKHGPFLDLLRHAGLRRHLNMRADFVRVRDDGAEDPVVVPKTTLEDMLTVPTPPLPPIQGISTTPVLSPTGGVVSEEGYHPDLQLYLNLQGLKLRPVPPTPPPVDVDAARSLLLNDLLVDFPFATDADRANSVALLLAPVVRPTIRGATPLHVLDAPMWGNGKGLLADVVVMIATGDKAQLMTEAKDEDEWRKRITAKLREAPAFTIIDNVRRRLDSQHLSSAITSSVWIDRDLGFSRMLRLPVRCTWMATGNNVSYSGEMSRRVVPIRLNAEVERPWERSDFRHDPLLEWVQENRGELLWGLLTLAQAWIAAGRPKGVERMGSFEEYAAIMGGILKVAGIPGFLTNREQVYVQATTDDTGWLSLLESWWKTYEAQRVTTDKVFELAKEKKLLTELRSGYQDQGARVVLGRELSARRDRVLGGFIIRLDGAGRGGVMQFHLDRSKV
jgi:hypothetical protein